MNLEELSSIELMKLALECLKRAEELQSKEEEEEG